MLTIAGLPLLQSALGILRSKDAAFLYVNLNSLSMSNAFWRDYEKEFGQRFYPFVFTRFVLVFTA